GGERPGLRKKEDGERVVCIAGEEHQGDQKIVPNPNKLEDRERHGGRQAERQHDSLKQRPLTSSVDASGFQQVCRDADQEVAHQEDAERQTKRDVENDDAQDRSVRLETTYRTKGLV